jgi:hypothetical protein
MREKITADQAAALHPLLQTRKYHLTRTYRMFRTRDNEEVLVGRRNERADSRCRPVFPQHPKSSGYRKSCSCRLFRKRASRFYSTEKLLNLNNPDTTWYQLLEKCRLPHKPEKSDNARGIRGSLPRAPPLF